QDRWGAIIYRRVDEKRCRSRRGDACVAPPPGDSRHAARFTHGSTRSARNGQRNRAGGGDPGSGILIRLASCGLIFRGGPTPAGAAAVSRGGTALPAWAAATDDLSL